MKRITNRIGAFLLVFAMLAASFVPAAKPVRAADVVTIKLHYHRADNNYAGWDVWMWEAGKDGKGYAFADENGEKVATMTVTGGASQVGFIVRTESWEKDISDDQFIDIPEMVSGTVHIYVESGVKGYQKEYGDDAVKGIKMKKAEYNGKTQIIVYMTAPIEGDYKNVFSVTGRNGEVEIENVVAMGSTYQIMIKEALKKTSSYSVHFGENVCSVIMPNIYSTLEFENEFTYTGNDLGANWSKEKTVFKVWSPVADEMEVRLYKSGNEGTNDLIESIPMALGENGVWTAEKAGDLNGTYYVYAVTFDGVTTEVVDPYARTTGLNGKRGMVIDLASTNPEGWAEDKNPHAGESYNDAIIYEGHIRDLTVNANGQYPGKYLGLTELGTKTASGHSTGLSYITELGITHLHLLPVYDFGSVNEANSSGYNWGYDPVNYNTPEGSYSTDPTKGEKRVAEMKEMIKALHDNGISVVMDVVYNHVYNASEFSINQLVPGYFSRISESGSYSNGSGCGNDTASERSMVKKFIVDSVNYWADEYHFDGFRFDLVGLLDVDTINEIVESVHKKHPDVIFYGEGWSLTTNVTKEDVELAVQGNSKKTPNFAYFNDNFRDGLKGSVFDSYATGFVSGASGKEFTIANCFVGKTSWCKSPAQTINYSGCHDNNTLFDRLQTSRKDASMEELVAMNKLTAAIVLTAEGIPFLMSGEEILRTKKNADGSFSSDSYNAGDAVNALVYESVSDASYAATLEYYKGLIAFRKAHPVLRLTNAADVEKYVSRVENTPANTVVMSVAGGPEGEKAEKMYIIFNANNEETTINLPAGKWNIYVNGETAGTKALKTVTGNVKLNALSAMVLVQESGVEVKNGVNPLPIAIGASALVLVGAALAFIFTRKKK